MEVVIMVIPMVAAVMAILILVLDMAIHMLDMDILTMVAMVTLMQVLTGSLSDGLCTFLNCSSVASSET
jgi:hypothetical protein